MLVYGREEIIPTRAVVVDGRSRPDRFVEETSHLTHLRARTTSTRIFYPHFALEFGSTSRVTMHHKPT